MELALVIFVTFVLFIQAVDGRKNVLFLVADDLRPELPMYYGPYFPSTVHPPIHAPNLMKLSAKSMVFKRAYVQVALCSPSRTSFLTSRRPDTTHVYDLSHYWRRVSGNFTSLPQYFKEHGYRSIGIGKIYHPGEAASNNNDPPSWTDKYYSGEEADKYFFNVTSLSWQMSYNRSQDIKNPSNSIRAPLETSSFIQPRNPIIRGNSWQAVPERFLGGEHTLRDTLIANHAVEVIKDIAKSDDNFFLAVGFRRPHLPFEFPARFLDYYPEDSIHLPSNPYAPQDMPQIAWSSYRELVRYADIAQMNISGQPNTTLPDQVVKDLRRAYYSAVSYMDFELGRVLDELEKQGLANDTIISFIGDHGWQLGEHGEWCKITNFDIATHAPMMIHIPGLTDGGKATTKLIEFVDLFPTLVEAAGLPHLQTCPIDSVNTLTCTEGMSLMPLMRNPSLDSWKNVAFSQFYRDGKVMGYSLTNERYRYTEWVGFHDIPQYKPDWSRVSGVELYDHHTDPEENVNLANNPTYSSVCSQLQKVLHEGWRGQLQDHQGTSIIG